MKTVQLIVVVVVVVVVVVESTITNLFLRTQPGVAGKKIDINIYLIKRCCCCEFVFIILDECYCIVRIETTDQRTPFCCQIPLYYERTLVVVEDNCCCCFSLLLVVVVTSGLVLQTIIL